MMMLATTIADSMIHLPIRAEKSIEESFPFQGERVLVYSLGAFARRFRFDSPPRVRSRTFLLDFTELGKNSLLAAESWMMAYPSNYGRDMQQCMNEMETSGACRKRRAFGFSILTVEVGASSRFKTGAGVGNAQLVARAISQRNHGKTAAMTLPRWKRDWPPSDMERVRRYESGDARGTEHVTGSALPWRR